MAPPDLASIRTGQARDAAAAFTEALPQRAAVVRGFNDLLWRATGGSYMARKTLVTGQGDVLQGLDWLHFYCGHVERPLPPFQFSFAFQPSEREYDADLLDLLNVAHVPASPPAPEVAPVPSAAPIRPSLATVSDSYMRGVLELLQRARSMRHIDAFNYLILERRTFDPVLAPHPIDQNSPSAFAPLLAADMIVPQEVDHRVGGPFVLYFLTLMEHAMAHNGALLSPSKAAR